MRPTSTRRAGEGMRRFGLRSGLDPAAGEEGEASISALPWLPGESCTEVPPLGREYWSTPIGIVPLSVGKANGANGLTDDDVAIDCCGLIAP